MLEARGFAGLVVFAESGRDPAMAPFVGSSRLGRCFLVAGAQSPPLLAYLTPMEREEAASTGQLLVDPESLDLARWSRQGCSRSELGARVVSQLVALSGLKFSDGPLALAGRPPAGDVIAVTERLATQGWSFGSGEELIRRLRKSKSRDQLGELKSTAATVERAFRRVAEILAAASRESRDAELSFRDRPLTLGRLRGEIDSILAAGGLEQPEGSIVASGGQAAIPHSTGDRSRVLAKGESLIVDLFPRHRLFADCTRTFCVGTVPTPLARAHRVVRAALSSATRAARPGVAAWELQELVCAEIDAAGYPTPLSSPGTQRGYVHGLGHGVGYELHELPIFAESQSIDGVLCEGDVFTLEPGLYDPDAGWGVRLEDLLVMTAEGPKTLIDLPYDLDPLEW